MAAGRLDRLRPSSLLSILRLPLSAVSRYISRVRIKRRLLDPEAPMLVAKMEFTFSSRETDIITQMRFNFEASDRQDDDGDWEASDQPSENLAMIYLGHKDGAWDMLLKNDGKANVIWMREFEKPGYKFWKDSPDRVAAIDYSSRVPFMSGENGTGISWGHPMLHFKWKIIAT
jgi:hypothetical protein